MKYRRNTEEDQEKMLAALKGAGATQQQLADLTGLSKITVHRWLGEGVSVHVVDYTEDARGRRFVPVYRYGKGKDAPRPGPALTAAQRVALSRARKKKKRADDLF